MAELPEEDLAATRAALAPTLDATAAILPWLGQAKPSRFPAALNQRWISAGQRLAGAWLDRYGPGGGELRPALFALYAVALDSADADCLRLGEALASAADRLDNGAPPRLIAALSSAIETLNDPQGLEHEAFADRARHFAERLEQATVAPDAVRSAVIDQLFIDEALERIDLMHDALAALPVDAYALAVESTGLAQQAEQVELWGIMHLARQLAAAVRRHANDLDAAVAQNELTALLEALTAALAAVDT